MTKRSMQRPLLIEGVLGEVRPEELDAGVHDGLEVGVAY